MKKSMSLLILLVLMFPGCFAVRGFVTEMDLENELEKLVMNLDDNGSLNNDVNATCFFMLVMNAQGQQNLVKKSVDWLKKKYDSSDIEEKCLILYTFVKTSEKNEEINSSFQSILKKINQEKIDKKTKLMLCIVSKDLGYEDNIIERLKKELDRNKDQYIENLRGRNDVFGLKLCEEYFGENFFDEKRVDFLLENYKKPQILWILLEDPPKFTLETFKMDNEVSIVIKNSGRDATVLALKPLIDKETKINEKEFFVKKNGKEEIKWDLNANISLEDLKFYIEYIDRFSVFYHENTGSSYIELKLYSTESPHNENNALKTKFEAIQGKEIPLILEIINKNGDQGKIEIKTSKGYALEDQLNRTEQTRKIPFTIKFSEPGENSLTININIFGDKTYEKEYRVFVKEKFPFKTLVPVTTILIVLVSSSAIYIHRKRHKTIITYGYKELKGKIPVLVTAPHATPPNSDMYTGEIVQKLAEKTGAWGLVSTISRNEIDYNRVWGRGTPFRKRINDLIKKRKIKYILDIHGMKDRGLGDVELGTKMGTSASPDFISKLKEAFEKEGIKCNIESIGFTGGDIIEYHSNPPFVEAVQIEISRTLREYHREKIVDVLSKFIGDVVMEDKNEK